MATCARIAPTPPSGDLFNDDDQLLLEVRAGEVTVTDSLLAYASRRGVFLPLGELARVLDLAVTVYPAEQKATGWILKESRTLTVDLQAHIAEVGGQAIWISADEAEVHADEIYVRLDLMEKLLPIALNFDARGIVLGLRPREPLPFQQRLERERRSREIGGSADHVKILKVATPYLIASPPSFDLTLDGTGGSGAPNATGYYELRAAGDLAWSSMQAFAGSDMFGRLQTVRLTLGRKDYDGRLFGPLRGREFEVGDTFTPSLSLGERSISGRGVMFSSAPLDAGGVSSHLDQRGELPDGWQVELYVNEVLVGSQTTPNQGRYEFLSVPLSFGANTLRLVFFGPHGEHREEVRHYNFGGSHLEKGELAVRFGVVQQLEDLVNIPLYPGPGGVVLPNPIGQSALRAVAEIQYGLTPTIGLEAGFAQFTPAPGPSRRIIEGGLQSSVYGMALQLNAAKDLSGGQAQSLSLAGRLGRLNFIARDSEYQGLFYDENQRSGVIAGTPLTRSAELRLDWVERAFRIGSGIPISLDVQYDQKRDGSTYTTADARFSITPDGYLVASSLGFSRTAGEAGGSFQNVWGEVEISRLLGTGWQARGGMLYQMAPTPLVQSVFLNLDRALSTHNSLRLAINQSLSSRFASHIQLTDTWRLKAADVAVTASYDSGRRDARLELQLSLGLMFDPSRGRYRLVRPGATSGGDAAFTAFTDTDGDGRREPGEAPVANMALESQGPPAATDAGGHALLTSLGTGPTARIHVRTDTVEDPFAVGPADVVEFTPRPGRVTQIYYGLKPVGELQLRLLLPQPNGSRKGVSGLDVQLVGPDNKVVAEDHTEFDGTMFVEKLPPGAYAVRIEPGQAKRLGLDLAKPLTARIPPQGGFVANVVDELAVRQ